MKRKPSPTKTARGLISLAGEVEKRAALLSALGLDHHAHSVREAARALSDAAFKVESTTT